MSTFQPCLVIVFNHKFDRNIEVLEKLYQERFQHIFFLVPFYTGTNPRVIPVYESSYCFQGYIAQGFARFRRPEFTHYLFIGDDLILNPAVNEHNYAGLLKLDAQTSYVPELAPLHEPAASLDVASGQESSQTHWWHAFKAVTFYENRSGSEITQELPSYEEALACFAEHDIHIRPLTYYNVFGPVVVPTNWRAALEAGRRLWTYYVSWRRRKVPGRPQQLQLPYPLVYGYSDITAVAAPAMPRFCHLCGVFAAMGLFVEMALPTALLLSGGRIVTEAQADLKGLALWRPAEVAKLEEKYQLNLDALLTDFPARRLYYHPVKLSRWRRNEAAIADSSPARAPEPATRSSSLPNS